MEQYIPKSALVAEIEKLVDKGKYHEEFDCAFRDGNNAALDAVKEKINTLEVKEVDLKKEINYWQGCAAFPEGVGITPLPKAMEIVERTARHFFELGIKAQKGE